MIKFIVFKEFSVLKYAFIVILFFIEINHFKTYDKTNVENAASVKAQALKREAKHIELTKAQ